MFPGDKEEEIFAYFLEGCNYIPTRSFCYVYVELQYKDVPVYGMNYQEMRRIGPISSPCTSACQHM